MEIILRVVVEDLKVKDVVGLVSFVINYGEK